VSFNRSSFTTLIVKVGAVPHGSDLASSCCSCRWGETTSLNCGHKRVCCSSPSDTWAWRATVEWYWQGNTEELGQKSVPLQLCPLQIPHGLTWVWIRASTSRLTYNISIQKLMFVCN
jgi:hypothetical protein